MKKRKVIIRKKSNFQKDDCLFCEDNATLEAVCGEGRITTMIRCCKKVTCKKQAKELALEQLEALLPKTEAVKTPAPSLVSLSEDDGTGYGCSAIEQKVGQKPYVPADPDTQTC